MCIYYDSIQTVDYFNATYFPFQFSPQESIWCEICQSVIMRQCEPESEVLYSSHDGDIYVITVAKRHIKEHLPKKQTSNK